MSSFPVALIDLAMLMFSFRFQKRRTSPLTRGALPSCADRLHERRPVQEPIDQSG